MSESYRISCVQTRPKADFESALEEALRLGSEAAEKGAQLILFPEYCGGLRVEKGRLVPPASTEHSHPVLAGLRRFATEKAVWLLVGSVAVASPCGKIFNRSYIVDSEGKVDTRYDKIHLFDVNLSEKEIFRESAGVLPGTHAVIADTPFGRIGLSICYDLRFPTLYRRLAQIGSEAIAVPAAFTKVTGSAHWHVLNRARAIENGCYVFAPGAVGPVPGGGEAYGHSLIVDPWGAVLADGGDSPGTIAADINLSNVDIARSKIPSLDHDRPFGIYHEL